MRLLKQRLSELTNRKNHFYFILLLVVSINFTVSAQENPWTNKQTENPWRTASKETKTKEVEIEATPIDTINFVLASDSVPIQKLVFEVTETDTVTTAPIVASAPQVRQIDLYAIERKAHDDYNAGIALGASIPSILFPPITFPILVASVFVQTPQQSKMIENYKLDNPTATGIEIKALKRGIRKKRGKRTAGGAGIGLGILAAIFAIGIAVN